MIQSFADKETERVWKGVISRKIPADIQNRAFQKLRFIHAASLIESLRFPPSNQLHALQGNLKGKWAIRINDQWRICFKFEAGNAYDVEITDYH
jgi:proteic killer suppression protein